MKIKINNVIKGACLLLALLLLCPSPSAASDASDLQFGQISFEGINGYQVCSDIKTVNVLFRSWVDVNSNAKLSIMSGNKVMAETSNIEARVYQESSTILTAVFSQPVRLPKGESYKAVLSEGAVHSHNSQMAESEEYVQDFSVPDDFVGASQWFVDGCAMSSLHIGGFDFGEIETEKTGDAEVLLYRGTDLLETCSMTTSHTVGHGYMNFDFGKRVSLDEGVQYELVVPKGSVRSRFRDDIVNKEMRIRITGAAYIEPTLGEESESGPAVTECTLGYGGRLVFGDIENPAFYFKGNIGVAEDAVAYIMSGNEVMATSSKLTVSSYGGSSTLGVVFDAPVRLPKDGSYRLVIPAGKVYDKDAPGDKAGLVARDFKVPGDFVASTGTIYDGCILESLHNGSFGFGTIETVNAKDDAALYLYKGENVFASCPINAKWDFDAGYMDFDFGKTIELEKDVKYTLLLPEGSVCTRLREDIVNKEMRINIYGPKSGTGVEGVASGAVSVSCRGSILRICNVQQGQLVEVFSYDGRLVQRVKATQTSVEIPLPGKGCYVVRVGGKTMKGVLN